MFKSRTLFIVGAGASEEFGLPVGAMLAATISKKLNILYDESGVKIKTGDAELWEQIHYTYQKELREYQGAAWLIRDGILFSSSIDDFLDVHNQNKRAVHVGKTAIIKSILEAERSSKLFYDNSSRSTKMNVSKLEGTWLIKFVRMLGRGIPLEKAETIFENVAFVVFNYDRCIEYFLFVALQQLYNIDQPRAAKLLQGLCIIHPYGSVASLPHESNDGISFGGAADRLVAPYLTLSDQVSCWCSSC